MCFFRFLAKLVLFLSYVSIGGLLFSQFSGYEISLCQNFQFEYTLIGLLALSNVLHIFNGFGKKNRKKVVSNEEKLAELIK